MATNYSQETEKANPTKLGNLNRYLCIYLDQDANEFEEFKNEFYSQVSPVSDLWEHHQNMESVLQLIETAKRKKKEIILVSSGQELKKLIEKNGFCLLHYVYIYCYMIQNYEDLQINSQVKGIFTKRTPLVKKVISDLQMLSENQQSLEGTLNNIYYEAVRQAAQPTNTKIYNNQAAETFSQPEEKFCPWNEGVCTKKFPNPGKGTLAISQKGQFRLVVKLSGIQSKDNLKILQIILSIDLKSVSLNIIQKTYDPTNLSLLTTTQKEFRESSASTHCIQKVDNQWHRYWISIFADDCRIQYGIGEVRSSFAIFDVSLENMVEEMRQIEDIKLKINDDDDMLTKLYHLKDEFHFTIGNYPVKNELPLLVVASGPTSIPDVAGGSKIIASNLPRSCQQLYNVIQNVSLDDADFPDFIKAIDYCVRKSDGFCRKLLTKKVNGNPAKDFRTSYLRVTVGEKDGSAPGHAFVIEVWPPGHYSPIHSHSNAYAIIKVLTGSVLVKIFPELSELAPYHQTIATVLKEGDVTWMSRDINQTHQLRNIDIYHKTAVTIQCYQYGSEPIKHGEFFEFLKSDGRSLDGFLPKSDIDFNQFKEAVRAEWNARSQI